MQNLSFKDLVGKNLRIIDKNGIIFEGMLTDIIKDSEKEKENNMLELDFFTVNQSDIKHIELM